MAGNATSSRQSLTQALGSVAKAHAAVQALSDNFDGWMHEEVAKLDAAREALPRDGYGIEAVSVLYMRAHDLKGLAPTFGYPLIHQLAAGLCVLIDDDNLPFESRLPLIDDHIDAIRTLASKRVRSQADAFGRKLVAQLESDLRQLMEQRV